MIHIFYMTKVGIGGWATFTRHLVDTLIARGQEVQLCKIGNNTEGFTRPFGDQGHTYRNIHPSSFEEFRGERIIIAALGKHYIEEAETLMKMGAGMVIHDTAESSNRMKLHKPWVIRRALLGQAEGSVFIRHPYVRHTRPWDARTVRRGAVATSRVDFDKNTRMILDANRLGAKIDIIGFENRLYTKFKIVPDYPEWVQSKGDHPRTGAGSFQRLCEANFMVDLTDIKGDGGGTQYTFLEAWDAGAVPVIGSWWLRPRDDMAADYNCIPVTDAQYLAKIVKGKPDNEKLDELRKRGYATLVKHAPKVIGPQIMEWLDAR